MTNDTNTLNGALTELGELMADNLVTMGVTDADASDGLTTLANKILDVPQGGSCITIDLVSDKSILSYESRESATLTATVKENGTVKSGATVEFFKNSTSLGTATTDSSGIATKTYNSSGSGNISLTAQSGVATSNTCNITDGFYYDGTTHTSNDLNIPVTTIPSNFELSFKMKVTTSTGSVNIGSNSSYIIVGCIQTSTRPMGVILGSTKYLSGQSLPNNTEVTIKYTHNNGTHTIQYNDNTVYSFTSTFTTGRTTMQIGCGSGTSIRDILYLPLGAS